MERCAHFRLLTPVLAALIFMACNKTEDVRSLAGKVLDTKSGDTNSKAADETNSQRSPNGGSGGAGSGAATVPDGSETFQYDGNESAPGVKRKVNVGLSLLPMPSPSTPDSAGGMMNPTPTPNYQTPPIFNGSDTTPTPTKPGGDPAPSPGTTGGVSGGATGGPATPSVLMCTIAIDVRVAGIIPRNAWLFDSYSPNMIRMDLTGVDPNFMYYGYDKYAYYPKSVLEALAAQIADTTFEGRKFLNGKGAPKTYMTALSVTNDQYKTWVKVPCGAILKLSWKPNINIPWAMHFNDFSKVTIQFPPAPAGNAKASCYGPSVRTPDNATASTNGLNVFGRYFDDEDPCTFTASDNISIVVDLNWHSGLSMTYGRTTPQTVRLRDGQTVIAIRNFAVTPGVQKIIDALADQYKDSPEYVAQGSLDKRKTFQDNYLENVAAFYGASAIGGKTVLYPSETTRRKPTTNHSQNILIEKHSYFSGTGNYRNAAAAAPEVPEGGYNRGWYPQWLKDNIFAKFDAATYEFKIFNNLYSNENAPYFDKRYFAYGLGGDSTELINPSDSYLPQSNPTTIRVATKENFDFYVRKNRDPSTSVTTGQPMPYLRSMFPLLNPIALILYPINDNTRYGQLGQPAQIIPIDTCPSVGKFREFDIIKCTATPVASGIFIGQILFDGNGLDGGIFVDP